MGELTRTLVFHRRLFFQDRPARTKARQNSTRVSNLTIWMQSDHNLKHSCCIVFFLLVRHRHTQSTVQPFVLNDIEERLALCSLLALFSFVLKFEISSRPSFEIQVNHVLFPAPRHTSIGRAFLSVSCIYIAACVFPRSSLFRLVIRNRTAVSHSDPSRSAFRNLVRLLCLCTVWQSQSSLGVQQ